VPGDPKIRGPSLGVRNDCVVMIPSLVTNKTRKRNAALTRPAVLLSSALSFGCGEAGTDSPSVDMSASSASATSTATSSLVEGGSGTSPSTTTQTIISSDGTQAQVSPTSQAMTSAPGEDTEESDTASTASSSTDAESTQATTEVSDVVPSGEGCVVGDWPDADPATEGPFEVATEENVGPEAGEAEEDGTVPRFTLFRPEDMKQSGLCHPVITWGNGTGSTPNLYGGLLKHLASHGFVVIGSNSTNVSRGEPKPMNVGIDWVLEQNADPESALYQRLDVAHIGATGHSQGAMATSRASSDERVVTSVPIEGAQVQRDLHGPAMFFCGGMDDIVGCDGARQALDAVDTLPAMYANYLSVDHGSWLSFGGRSRTDVEIAITAWMRVHLMADTALRPWFYGESCELCTNDAWEIDRKNMTE
jgi:Chlorophyllase enzyme